MWLKISKTYKNETLNLKVDNEFIKKNLKKIIIIEAKRHFIILENNK